MCPPYVLPMLCILTGFVGALNISAYPQVTGYENDSITLAVSYEASNTTDWLQIRWIMVHPKARDLVICTRRSENNYSTFPENGYENRMTVDPETGTLTIKHLSKEDEGTYKMSIMDTTHENSILLNVTVLPAGVTESHLELEHDSEPVPGPGPTAIYRDHCFCSRNSSSIDVSTSAWIFFISRVSSFFITFFLLLFIYTKNRNRPGRRRLRTLPSRHPW
ncbi:uncharacterized protein [Engystomops pustulosus]|uniref:uncharacterized protein n=1 Tax=Engystomops pustulosus TaxID=76066 RepID=UPI003AFA0CF2